MLIVCAEEARVEHPEPQHPGAAVVFPGHLVRHFGRRDRPRSRPRNAELLTSRPSKDEVDWRMVPSQSERRRPARRGDESERGIGLGPLAGAVKL